MRCRFSDKLLALAILLVLAVPVPAAAAERCTASESILVLSELVLDRRLELPLLQQRRFGAIAAYLRTRYGDLPPEQVDTLLSDLLQTRAHGAAELATAWFVGRLGAEPAARLVGAAIDVRPEQVLFSLSAMRALVTGGEEDLLLEGFVAAPPARQVALFRELVVATIDEPDSVKQRIGAKALERGLPALAAGLAASQSTAEPWLDVLDRIGDPDQVSRLTQLWRWVPAAVGAVELPLPASASPGDPRLRQRLHAIGRVAAMQPEREFLLGLVNQTGLVDVAYAASTTLRRALEEGKVQPKGPLEAGWLVAYRALTRQLPQAIVDGHLAAVPTTARPPRRSVRDVLDWAIAAAALADYVALRAPGAPRSPEEVSADFAWEDWVTAAARLRSGKATGASLDTDGLARAAELLLAAGRLDDLAELLREAPPSLAGVALAEDLARRLDRTCAAYLWHTAEAVLLVGLPIFKFDEAPRLSDRRNPSP